MSLLAADASGDPARHRRPGANVIKLFMAVIYECASKAIMFVLGGPFQPSVTNTLV